MATVTMVLNIYVDGCNVSGSDNTVSTTVDDVSVDEMSAYIQGQFQSDSDVIKVENLFVKKDNIVVVDVS